MGHGLKLAIGAVALVLTQMLASAPGFAQDAPDAADATPPMPRPAELEGFLSEAELDDLVAPVALYPDSLLTQVFVASTVPLEVVKADRFLDENAGLEDKARADAAEAEDWDPSLQVLAGGFPTVVQMMADDIDWTEALGEAVLAQTDDVLDAVQRMRARAEAAGNLASNEAQTVTTTGESITISSSSPEIVYVPTYDPAVAYYPPTTVVDNVGGDLLTTGVIAFGTALLVDEIFDDDDDWDDYWRGPPVIDWDDGDFYPRPDIDIEGDVNIDRDRIDIDRDRVDIDRDGVADRIGDRGDGRRREGAWQPSDEQRQAARDRLADREMPGAGAGAAGARGDLLSARSGSGAGAGNEARARLERAGASRPAGERRPDSISALQPRGDSAERVHRASDRGGASVSRGNRPQAAAHDRSRSASRPQSARRPAAHSPSRSSAFKQHSSGARASQASRRASGGGRGGGRGGGGRRR